MPEVKKRFTKRAGPCSTSVESSHSGQDVVVEGPCDPAEKDTTFGPMFVIRFSDGLHGIAFADELT